MAKNLVESSTAKAKQRKVERATATDKKTARSKAGQSGAKQTATKKPRKTAAQAVRDFMQTHPHLRNREIVQALAEEGIVIDDTIPAQIKSRDKLKKNKTDKTKEAVATPRNKPAKSRKPATSKATTARDTISRQPTIFVHSPVHEAFAQDLLSVRTHSQAIKNLRIHVAKLERIIAMMETLKEDDWQLTLLAQPDGLLFSAVHGQAHNAAQARARLEKLEILPNEVVLVDA